MRGFLAVVMGLLAMVSMTLAQEELKTANDFDAVHSSGKHTFVKFYAPWCGHCKRLAPVWSDLAKKYAGNEQLSIMKVDCTLQNMKDVCSAEGVRGYPTLKFFKAGSGEGEKYQGSRSIDDFDTFLKRFL